ncbi:sterol desaturase family protein [Mesorhizobium neociceri]|uniref:Sterol desaturase family protein n=1 Tax=Mesorhizobium neociceri TaxID=1307853 RepID=A0A838B847_9HYPH|nr:sterol desaturase family protein [Mesorhizobium neociceri]MBA1142257.1 sterol desaturase family protein [Mesorhizobium neociceri]
MSDLVDLKAVLVIALIFIPLERLLPLHAEQSSTRRHWLNDVVYLLFNGIITKIGLLLVIGTCMLVLDRFVPAGLTQAVQSQPVWLQAVEVLVLADTGFYLAHRAFHAVPFLWRFHSIHHSIEEMDWLAAHRVHPVDQILTKSASFLPIFALGFSTTAILIFTLIYQWQSLFIHSNTRIKFGPLKWLLASPQFHHWHHANEREAWDKNFAGQLPLLDMLGGTLFMPDRMPQKYGTDDPVPPLYHQQLAYPFVGNTERLAQPARLAEASPTSAGKSD